jgi:hypothetical protein
LPRGHAARLHFQKLVERAALAPLSAAVVFPCDLECQAATSGVRRLNPTLVGPERESAMSPPSGLISRG